MTAIATASRFGQPGRTNTGSILDDRAAVRGGILALINSEIFGAGDHRVRVQALDEQGDPVAGGSCDWPLRFTAPR